MRRGLHKLLAALLLASGAAAYDASALPGPIRTKDFQPVCDSLLTLLKERTGVEEDRLSITRVRQHGTTFDLYFSSQLSYYPWHEEDIDWFRATLSGLCDSIADGSRLGRIYTNRYELPQLALPHKGSDGRPSGYGHSIPDPTQHPGPKGGQRVFRDTGGSAPFPGGTGRQEPGGMAEPWQIL